MRASRWARGCSAPGLRPSSRGCSGPPTPLDPAGTRRQAGVDADARAYLLLRPYVKTSVRVEVTDPADPTPYWLLSSRHPQALAAALDAATGRLAARQLTGED